MHDKYALVRGFLGAGFLADDGGADQVTDVLAFLPEPDPESPVQR